MIFDKKTNKLKIAYIKILLTVSELNNLGYYPLAKAIYNLLTGHIDEDTYEFRNILTANTYISCSQRKITTSIKQLLRNGYLTNIYDIKTDNLYLKISESGREAISLLTRKDYKKIVKTPRRKELTVIKI